MADEDRNRRPDEHPTPEERSITAEDQVGEGAAKAATRAAEAARKRKDKRLREITGQIPRG